jgi:hypothetical protein
LRSGNVFTPIHPIRLVDTKHGVGLSEKVQRESPTVFKVTGEAGIPADAVAITGSVEATRPGNNGWLLVADNVEEPRTSTLNFTNWDTRRAGFVLGLATDGSLSVYSTVTVDIIIDVTGYFTV